MKEKLRCEPICGLRFLRLLESDTER
jgi:hypothetical protein